MAQIRITTTSSEGLRPLGQDGQRSYEMIAALVRSRLGPDHALLFAEPVAARGGAETDWYVQAEGAAQRLQDLAETDQEIVRLRLSEMVANITRLADELENSGGDSNARLSESLRNSLEVPDEGAVHVVRDSQGALLPVLVDWATLREDRDLFRGVLSGIAPRKPEPAQVAPSAVVPVLSGTAPLASAAPIGLGWILWTILAGVLIAITVLLIAPCGLRGFTGTSFCTLAETVDPSGALAEQAALQDRIAALQLAIIRADQACPTPLAPAPPPPSPEQDPRPAPAPSPEPALLPQGDPEIENRLNNQQGQRGDMNVSLVWNTLSDIDLAVTCPNGVTISFGDRAPAQCPGRLDVDANVSRSRATPTPIENIFFENPQTGSYQIEVSLFSRHGVTGDLPFTVQVRLGDTIRRFSGSVGASSTRWQTSFDYEAPR